MLEVWCWPGRDVVDPGTLPRQHPDLGLKKRLHPSVRCINLVHDSDGDGPGGGDRAGRDRDRARDRDGARDRDSRDRGWSSGSQRCRRLRVLSDAL